MIDPLVSPLASWANFYMISGAAGATLTGLQFVVIALVGQSRVQTSAHQIAAFGTPTLLHFGAALLIAALMVAPWSALAGPVILLTMIGVAGIAYSILVIRRVAAQREYVPELEDWIFHVALPLIAYGAITIAGILLFNAPTFALFTCAAATFTLIAIGVHNAWDTVIFITIRTVTPGDR